MNHLIRKYNVPGPRYTSYPTVPFWNEPTMDNTVWETQLKSAFQKEDNNEISLYIHLPFCESLCTFCGCHKHITKNHSVEEGYITLLTKEWNLYRQLLAEKPVVKAIHLGGGTPTFFTPKNLEQLIKTIANSSTIHPDAEMSFEGHPNNTQKEHLAVLNELGFNRVSFGIQDYDPVVQKSINRIQPYETVEKAHQQAKNLGYAISHDLVYGLPKQTLASVENSINNTLLLQPSRISLYSYAHVPWIKGLGQRGYSEADLPQDEEKRALYEFAKDRLIKSGYVEIGMDHFALKSDPLYQAYSAKKLHRNFMGYTTQSSNILIGLGMSAISDSGLGFAQNKKSVKEYKASINNNELAIFRGHSQSETDMLIQRMIHDLMCHFHCEWPDNFIESHLFPSIKNKLEPLVLDGLAFSTKTGLTVTDLGRLFIRNICMCFDQYLSQQPTKNMFSKTV